MKALKLAAQLAKSTGAGLILVTVISDRPPTPAELEASPDDEAGPHPTLVEPAFASLPGEFLQCCPRAASRKPGQ